MLVLSLGLPRLFVLCVGPQGDAHVEMVHASGSCCAHDHASGVDDGGALDGDRDLAGRLHGGCTDLSLALETAPMPKGASVDLDQQPFLVSTMIGGGDDAGWPVPGEGPPTTGPPRVDRRTALRTSTVLRL